MRTTKLAAALTIAVLLLAAPLAVAASGHGKGRDAADAHRPDAAKRGAGDDAADDANATGRPAAVTAFLDALRDMRESWKENRTSIREACHAEAADGENKTKAPRHCMRDGHKAFWSAWTAQLRALRADVRASQAHV